MAGKIIRAIVALAMLSGLSGCCVAEDDLIGEHAVRLVQSDSLITLSTTIYRIDQTRNGYVACELRLKTDNARNCWEQYLLKFEKTTRGNLLVQAEAKDAKFMDEGSRVFLLAPRSPVGTYSCYYILGADAEGDSEAVRNAVRAITGSDLDQAIDRTRLLEIVDTYERTVLPLETSCPNRSLDVKYTPGLRLEGEKPIDSLND